MCIRDSPYIGQNDSIAEQQSYKTWWFSKKFTLNELPENPILSFGGVANRCTVWLNGKKLGSHAVSYTHLQHHFQSVVVD